VGHMNMAHKLTPLIFEVSFWTWARLNKVDFSTCQCYLGDSVHHTIYLRGTLNVYRVNDRKNISNRYHDGFRISKHQRLQNRSKLILRVIHGVPASSARQLCSTRTLQFLQLPTHKALNFTNIFLYSTSLNSGSCRSLSSYKMVSSTEYELETYGSYNLCFLLVTLSIKLSLPSQFGQSAAHFCGAVYVSLCMSRDSHLAQFRDRWEFLTTLDFEWQVYTGRRPWKWPYFMYIATRTLSLTSIIIVFVVFDVTSEVNCEVHLLDLCR
jgi:hypothetical protein